MRFGTAGRLVAGVLGAVVMTAGVGGGVADAACTKATTCPYRAVSTVGGSDVLFADGASALGFDGRDALYALDADRGTIGVLDPATAQVRQRLLRFGSAPGDLAGARGIAVAADGTVEVADSDQVKRFDVAGRRLAAWPVPGITALSLGAGGITWTADGSAVSAYSSGGALVGSVRVGPEDAPAFPVTVAAGPARVLSFGAALPPIDRDATLGTVGTPGLYALRLDGTPAFTPNCDTDAEPAAGVTCFPFPVAAAPDGTFWFAVDDRHLAHVDGDAHGLGTLTLALPAPAGAPGRPRAIAVSPAGRIAVATSDGTILVLDPGQVVPRLTVRPAGRPSTALVRPAAVAVARDHRVYVADAAGLVVRRYSAKGRRLARWALPASADAITGLGTVGRDAVAAAGVLRVWLYGPSGKLRRSFRVGSGIDRMATGPDGRIYVLEAAGERARTARIRYVRVYDARGRQLRRVALKAKAPVLATGLAIDPAGGIHVTSAGDGSTSQANAVLNFTPTGKAQRPLGADQPQGIAVDGQGRTFVTADEAAPAGSDPGGPAAVNVYRAGRLRTVVGTTGSRAGELHHPRGVAVDVVGGRTVVWVCDAGNHRLVRFVLR